jgi:hypothetical protein
MYGCEMRSDCRFELAALIPLPVWISLTVRLF